MATDKEFYAAVDNACVSVAVDLSCHQRWAELVGFFIELGDDRTVTAILNELRKHLNTEALKADSNNPNDPRLYE